MKAQFVGVLLVSLLTGLSAWSASAVNQDLETQILIPKERIVLSFLRNSGSLVPHNLTDEGMALAVTECRDFVVLSMTRPELLAQQLTHLALYRLTPDQQVRVISAEMVPVRALVSGGQYWALVHVPGFEKRDFEQRVTALRQLLEASPNDVMVHRCFNGRSVNRISSGNK